MRLCTLLAVLALVPSMSDAQRAPDPNRAPGAEATPEETNRQETSHLTVTTSAPNAPVAPGRRFSIALDIVPKPGVHVYAPGQHDYRVVAVRVEPHDLIRTFPVAYPPSQDYFFEPLNEHVPVYERPFRLRQELEIRTAGTGRSTLRPGDSLRIKGTLAYQACTDTICFPPEEVPLAWTVTLKGAP